MTSKKEKQERDPNDYYPTPPWAVLRFLEKAHWRLPSGIWLEPAAGNGLIIETVNKFYKTNNLGDIKWKSVEIQEKFKSDLSVIKDNTVTIADYKTYQIKNSVDVCITNPPYKEAESMIKKAMKETGCVAMLLRINFLSSEKRRDWIDANTPDVYVLPNRPHFRWEGSDATEYGWFVWDKHTQGKIRLLDTTPLAIRRQEKLDIRKAILEKEKLIQQSSFL